MIVGNEPNLNRFWLPQFDAAGERRRRARLPGAADRGLRRASSEADAGRDGLGRRAGPARDRPARARAATRTRRRPSSATSARPTGRAGGRSRRSTASPSIPTRPARAFPPDRPTDPASTSILMADYEEKLRAAPRRGVRPRPARALQRARGRDADPARKASLYEGEEPGSAGRRGDPGRLLPARDRARRLPGERRRPAALPLPRRAGADRIPVRRLLRRRHAEVEPGARPQRDAAERTICP